MKIADNTPTHGSAASRAGTKERQDGRWLGDLERAWLANWTQLSGDGQDQRPQSSLLPPGTAAGPKAAVRSRQSDTADSSGDSQPFAAAKPASASSAAAGSGKAESKHEAPRAIAKALSGTASSPEFKAPDGVEVPVQSAIRASADTHASKSGQPMDAVAVAANSGQKALDWTETPLASVASDHGRPGPAQPMVQASGLAALPIEPANSVQAAAPSEPGVSMRGPLAMSRELATDSPACSMPDNTAVAASPQPQFLAAPSDLQNVNAPEDSDAQDGADDPITHWAPAYFPVQGPEPARAEIANVGVDATRVTPQVDASKSSMLSAAASSATEASAIAAPASIGKSGGIVYGPLGLSRSADTDKPSAPRDGLEASGHTGAHSRATAPTQGPPPDKTSLNVSTSGDAAQVTVRDSSLSGDEVLRVGNLLALQLQQLGFSSVKTYVNGVSRRIDSVYSSEAQPIDQAAAEPAPQVKASQ